MRDVFFSQSTRKHRIGRARARYVMDHGHRTVIPPGTYPDEQIMWIGLDDRGIELEVVAVEKPDGLLVIHVMPTSLRRRR